MPLNLAILLRKVEQGIVEERDSEEQYGCW